MIEHDEAILIVGAETQKDVDIELYKKILTVALEEAQQGRAEGGIPIGAAMFRRTGELVSRGHNRRVQDADPSVHGETDAFRRAGRQRSYRDIVMVTTLAPCWYCSGLVRQFRIGTLVVGDSRTFAGVGSGVLVSAGSQKPGSITTEGLIAAAGKAVVYDGAQAK